MIDRLAVWCIPCLLILALTASSAGSPTALDDPAIEEVLVMSEAGVSREVILARVARLDRVPVLSGEDLAALKQRGVDDAVLLELVRRGGEPLAVPEVPTSTDASRPATGAARIRVVTQPDFPVTYFEVAVGRDVVASEGILLRGESDPGGILKRPKQMRFSSPHVLYEADVAPGAHDVRVGFAVTTIAEDPDDEWSEYSQQRYINSGVALDEPYDQSGSWSTAGAANCEVAEGQVCEVVVLATGTKGGRLGGRLLYKLNYEVRVE